MIEIYFLNPLVHLYLRKYVPTSPLPNLSQENPSSSASRHINNNLIFFFLPFWTQWWRDKSTRELLKAVFCHQRKKKQESRHFLKICIFFSGICIKYLNPQVRINIMINEHTVPSSSELSWRVHPLIFLWTPKGFIFSPE